jgi:ABC-type transporter Mla MlaB component
MATAKRKHSGNAQQDASFEVLDGDRSRVTGALHFTTVSTLLPEGVAAIDGGSSGLALLIEWLSVAKAAGRSLRYENLPSQLHQIARLSEVEELLVPG